MEPHRLRRRIRCFLGVFATGLILSGVTAFPLVWEVNLLHSLTGPDTLAAGYWPALSAWIGLVREGLVETGDKYPFMAYGTDWLAFAHIVIAIVFIGPFIDPVRNRWVTEFGLIACALVIPLALICGPLRGIPTFWRAGDCSFGVLGAIPLALALRDIRKLERVEACFRPATDREEPCEGRD